MIFQKFIYSFGIQIKKIVLRETCESCETEKMQQKVQKGSHELVKKNYLQQKASKHSCDLLRSLLSHFEIIRYIVKSLIATLTHFLLKYN